MKRPPKRLDAFLARAGLGSRQQVRRLIRSGRVEVDGESCPLANTVVTGRAVRVDGEPVELLGVEHILLHKPVGYACSHNWKEAPIIDELLHGAWAHLGLEPAGRLDRETSGLIILTVDGALIHQLTSPRRKIPKRYRITYDGELPADAVQQCADGIPLEEEGARPTRPALLLLDDPGEATLFLWEGRNRQVRRMVSALGAKVTTLHRDRIGGLELPPDLDAGKARVLEPTELELLLQRDDPPALTEPTR